MLSRFTHDMSHVRVSFVSFPSMDLAIDVDLKSGVVPVPLHAIISNLVRTTVSNWVKANLVEPNSMKLPCIRTKAGGLSDDDVRKAQQAAVAASRMNGMKRG